MNESEIIIEIGAELGSITLFGTRTERGWLFTREVIDQTPELLDEEWNQYRSDGVESWEDALKLLDRSPWFKLYPLRVHPEFRRKVWLAIQERLRNGTEISTLTLGRWRDRCSSQ